MSGISPIFRRNLAATVLAVLASPALLPAAGPNSYIVHNLVSNIPGLADVTDPNLVDPWGMSASATSPFWLSNHFSGTATVISGAGVVSATVVVVPGGKGATSPTKPTGQVQNPTTQFVLANGRPASFIFVTEDGALSAWNTGTLAELKQDNSATAVYKGLAINPNATAPLLYAANFKSGGIDVFDGKFAPTTVPGGFKDPNLPAGFAPFNIWPVGGKLYVMYAKQDANKVLDVAGAGNGVVDVFDFNGNLLNRLITNGVLNSPWGIALAPPSWGAFDGALLVANFGDGTINAFDVTSGKLLGTLKNASGDNVVLPGLWAILFGAGIRSADPNTLYFVSGVPTGSTARRGIYGTIAPPAAVSGVSNAASGQSAAITPGEIVFISGQTVGPLVLASATLPATGTLGSTVGGTTVTFNGIPAPVLYAAGSQTGVIVPYGVAGSTTASVVVKAAGQTTAAFSIPVAASVPGLFTLNASGTGPGVIFNQDGTVNSATNSAAAGTVVVLFGTGEGVVSPPGQDGLISTSFVLRAPVLPVSVTIGGKAARVLYAGSAPGNVGGVVEVEAVVPADAGTGNQPVVLTVGTASSQTGVTVNLK